MFDKKSDYALNKMDSNAIVYTNADGSTVRITRDSFASEEEFLQWKEWSDEIYHIAEKGEHIQSNYTVSMEELPEKVASVPSVDEVLECLQIKKEKILQDKSRVLILKEHLTEIQFKRLWLYGVQKLSEQEIAVLEGISQQNVSKSILAAKKKAQKIFQKQGVKSRKNRR